MNSLSLTAAAACTPEVSAPLIIMSNMIYITKGQYLTGDIFSSDKHWMVWGFFQKHKKHCYQILCNLKITFCHACLGENNTPESHPVMLWSTSPCTTFLSFFISLALCMWTSLFNSN